MLDFIEKNCGEIVLRTDVEALGGARQVSRGLKALQEDGDLIKIGFGVYVKTRMSSYIADPMISIGFTEACLETLDRLKVEWEPGTAIKDYNAGRTQQVPARFPVRLKSRFRRKLFYQNSNYLLKE